MSFRCQGLCARHILVQGLEVRCCNLGTERQWHYQREAPRRRLAIQARKSVILRRGRVHRRRSISGSPKCSVCSAIRHQDNFNSAPFFSGLCIRAHFNARSVHTLFLVQILLGALGPLAREFLRTTLLGLRVTHHNDLCFRVSLQAHSHVIQRALTYVIRTRAVQCEIAFADFAGFRSHCRRLHRDRRRAIARTVNAVFRSARHRVRPGQQTRRHHSRLP